MYDDDPGHVEEVIQQRLANIGGYRIGGPQIGLRGLLVAFALAPCLIWLLYLAWPVVIAALPAPQVAPKLTPSEQREAARQYRQETPLIIGSFVPVVIITVVSGLAAFISVRGLGEHASYGVVTAVSFCGMMVIVALMLWIAGEGGISTIANADGSDVFALYALPSGITALVGAIVGWRVAEIA